MASRIARRLLVQSTWVQKSCNFAFNGLFTASRSRSTQVHPAVDVEKLSANSGPSPWKLCAAVCLVRLPILEEELTDFEKKYAALRDELEFEKSVLNDWELEKLRQQQLIKDIEAGKKNPEDIDFKETNQDLEDTYDASFKEFKESVEELDADTDFSNINRRPRDSLVLIVKQQLGNDLVWVLPREEWKEEEDLRESAERAVISHCGNIVDVDFISNAPSGFYKYKFPKGARSDARVGAKLFIYNAFIQRNAQTKATPTFKVEKTEKVLDHAWVAKDEMRNFMKPKFVAAIDKIVL